MSRTGMGFALFPTTLAKDFASAHHLQHLAKTVLVAGVNIAAFGIVWLLNFPIFNKLIAQIAAAKLHDEELAERAS